MSGTDQGPALDLSHLLAGVRMLLSYGAAILSWVSKLTLLYQGNTYDVVNWFAG
jgi:hypothetical protein